MQNEIDAREPTYENLVNEGPKWVQDESDLQQQSLKEQLDSIDSEWKDLHELSDARQKQLLQSLNYQVQYNVFKSGQTRKHCFLAMFPERGQTWYFREVGNNLTIKLYFSCSRGMQNKQIHYLENKSCFYQRMKIQ